MQRTLACVGRRLAGSLLIAANPLHLPCCLPECAPARTTCSASWTATGMLAEAMRAVGADAGSSKAAAAAARLAAVEQQQAAAAKAAAKAKG